METSNRATRRAQAAVLRQDPLSDPMQIMAATYWSYFKVLGWPTEFTDERPRERYQGTSTDEGVLLRRVAEKLRTLITVRGPQYIADVLRPAMTSRCASFQMLVYSNWFELSMPTVAVDAKLAASLTCMKLSPAVLDDFRPPFDTIKIEVPSGLLFMARPTDNAPCPVTSVWFGRYRDDAGEIGWGLLAGGDNTLSLLNRWSPRVAEIADSAPWTGEESYDPLGAELLDLDRRTSRLAGALAVNVCLMMQDKRSVREVQTEHGRTQRRHGAPAVRRFKLTRPVVHDMRRAVVGYGLHGGKSPTVQCVVAGHWKMQPCGPGGSQRKRIFIEPYWRGPEDAPIALRPHVLKPEPP